MIQAHTYLLILKGTMTFYLKINLKALVDSKLPYDSLNSKKNFNSNNAFKYYLQRKITLDYLKEVFCYIVVFLRSGTLL